MVRADSLNDDEDDILNATGIPVLYSNLRQAYLRSKSAREVNSSALLWEVTCTYDSHLESGQKVRKQRWEGEEVEEVIEHDQVTGNPVVNSVKEPLIITAPYTIPVLVIERLEYLFSPTLILNYSNRVNSAYFYGAPPGCALMKGPFGEEVDIEGTTWWNVTYRVLFNLRLDPDTNLPKGWFARPLNHGTKYLATTGATNYTHFTDENDEKITGNLNTNGTARSIGSDPVYLTFNRYRTANFNSLGLGPF
jgi:hypothetical protein